MIQEEVWKEWTPPFRYEVSSHGRVRVIYPDGSVKEKRGTKSSNGYRFFAIHVLIHRAVAQSFYGVAPLGAEVNHIDGDKMNNAAENLEYVTSRENMTHASRLGLVATGERHSSRTHPERVARGERHGSKTKPHRVARGDNNGSRRHPDRLMRGSDVGVSKLTEEKVREIRAKHAASGGRRGILSELGREYGVSHVNITAIVKRTTWRHVV